jgi:predicted double-glycine peptidase
LKSTEIYNGSKVAERQILLISKDDVSFNDMKRVIEDKGWKLLAKNFNLYQVDVSSQGESLDEILKMAESIPEVEVASVNSVSSPN